MATIQERRLASGETRFRAIVRIKGHQPRVKTFRRRTDAKLWATKLETTIRDGTAVQASKPEHTVGELLDLYCEDVFPSFKPRYRQQRSLHLSFWREHLGEGRALSRISRGQLTEGMRRLRRGEGPSGRRASPATCNRYLATLRAALSYAVREEWLDRNPARGLQVKEPRGRVRYLSRDEIGRLLAAIRDSGHPTLEVLVVLALATGARQGELLSLRWSDIDFEQGRAILDQTKNGDRRVLVFHSEALRLLRDLYDRRDARTDFVFPNQFGKPRFPRPVWIRALAQAEIEDFRFHDLRHTAASYLAMTGATPPEIAEVLGHKTLQMVQRYVHLSESHTRDVVRRMNDSIF